METRKVTEAALLIAVGLSIGLAVMGIAAVNGHDVEWETLITGFAAIGAALATVRQMRAADSSAALRHENLVALQHRPEWLTVQRGAMNAMLLIAAADKSEKARRPMEEHFLPKRQPNSGDVLRFEKAVGELLGLAAARPLGDCAPMFGASAAVRYELLSSCVADTKGYLGQLSNHLNVTAEPAPMSIVIPVVDTTRALEKVAVRVADDLLRLRDRYARFALPDLDDMGDIWNSKSLLPPSH